MGSWRAVYHCGDGWEGSGWRREEEEEEDGDGEDGRAATRCVTNETGFVVETAGKREEEGRERDFTHPDWDPKNADPVSPQTKWMWSKGESRGEK